MTKTLYFIFVFLYFAVISTVARSLDLVQAQYTTSDFATITDPNPLEALWLALKIVLDNLNTMLQFATLQVPSIPVVLQVFFVAPVGIGTVVTIVLIFRGTN